MILVIENFKIQYVLENEKEMDPIDLQKPKYQQKYKYWDRYYTIKTFLSQMIKMTDKKTGNPIRFYPYREHFKNMFSINNCFWDGSFRFDLDEDYDELIQNIKLSFYGRKNKYL